MKHFVELTDEEQKQAVKYSLSKLLIGVCDGRIRFNDTLNEDNLQDRIDKAMTKAAQLETPWFAHEYVMDTCADELQSMARSRAESGLYVEDDEHVVNLYEIRKTQI